MEKVKCFGLILVLFYVFIIWFSCDPVKVLVLLALGWLGVGYLIY